MSLFDNLGGVVGGLLGGEAQNLIPMAEKALSGCGGASGLLSQLESSGLGAEVSSWLGSGRNLPVTAQQIEQALSSDQLQGLASNLGIDTSKVSGLLSQILPQAVDQASPDGQLQTPA